MASSKEIYGGERSKFLCIAKSKQFLTLFKGWDGVYSDRCRIFKRFDRKQ